jgi:hypothetical protein
MNYLMSIGVDFYHYKKEKVGIYNQVTFHQPFGKKQLIYKKFKMIQMEISND